MRAFILVLLLVATPGFSADWGEVKAGIGGNAVELTSADKDLSLMWPDSVVPGDELLLSITTYKRYGEKFFRQYRFTGVSGSSLQIQLQGGTSGKGTFSAPTDPSMKETIFVERGADGAFDFVPKDLKWEGSFKIERSTKDPGAYSVVLKKRK